MTGYKIVNLAEVLKIRQEIFEIEDEKENGDPDYLVQLIKYIR